MISTNGAGPTRSRNAGTLRKTGAGPLSLGGASVPYVNTGTIDLQGGETAMTDSGTLANSGQLAVAAGTTFYLARGDAGGGVDVCGGGTLSMNGTTTVTADLTVTVPTALNDDADGAGDGADGGAVHVASAGTVSLAGGLEVLAGQTLTLPSNGANRWVIELVADQPRDGGDGHGQRAGTAGGGDGDQCGGRAVDGRGRGA